jgi:hypothetical protein
MPFPNPLSRGTYLSPPYPAMHEDKSSQVKGGGWVTLGLSDVQPPPGQSVLTRTSAPQGKALLLRRSDPRAGCSQRPRPRMGLRCSLARAHQEVCVRGGGGAADGRRVGRCGAAGQAHAAAGSDSGGLSCPLHSPRAVWARAACPRRRTELSVGSTGQSAERSACRILR